MQQVIFENIKNLDYKSNEAYKQFRTNILFSGSGIKVLCFTSCLPDEGKSNVSFHLAISIAESGKRVVFVDADLRKSVLIGRYKPDHAVLGLTHYLSGQNYMEEVLYKTNIDNLDVIFSGPIPPNPSELLLNQVFHTLLKDLRGKYDYVIIDTPPIVNVIDSVIIAEQCDGVVLVIEDSKITYKLAQRVKKQLERGNSKILGVVLNKVDFKSYEYGIYGKEYNAYYSDIRTETRFDKLIRRCKEMIHKLVSIFLKR